MGGFVAVGKDFTWNFDEEPLAAFLRSKFPGVNLRPGTRAARLKWEVRNAGGTATARTGFLSADGRVVGFGGDEYSCAQFAVLLRGVAPANVPLAVGDQHHGTSSGVARVDDGSSGASVLEQLIEAYRRV